MTRQELTNILTHWLYYYGAHHKGTNKEGAEELTALLIDKGIVNWSFKATTINLDNSKTLDYTATTWPKDAIPLTPAIEVNDNYEQIADCTGRVISKQYEEV